MDLKKFEKLCNDSSNMSSLLAVLRRGIQWQENCSNLEYANRWICEVGEALELLSDIQNHIAHECFDLYDSLGDFLEEQEKQNIAAEEDDDEFERFVSLFENLSVRGKNGAISYVQGYVDSRCCDSLDNASKTAERTEPSLC